MQFFKYYSASKDTEMNDVFAPLQYHSIRYTSPLLFNDPYDCKCFFEKVDGEKEDTLSLTINKSLRVACLTKHPQSPIMWAHYSSNHEGYVIEYEIDATNFKEVKYEDIKPFYFSSKQIREEILKKEPTLNDSEIDSYMNEFLLNNEEYMEKLMNAIFIKHKDWSYEKEYRFIDVNESGFNSDFIDKKLKTSQIRAILLGFKFNHRLYDKKLKEIIDSVYDGGINVYKANPSLDKYEMYFSPYKF